MFLGEERSLLNKLTSELLLTMIIMLVSCGFSDSHFCWCSGSELFDLESVQHSAFRNYRYFRLGITQDSIAKVRGFFALLLFLVL